MILEDDCILKPQADVMLLVNVGSWKAVLEVNGAGAAGAG